MQTFLAILCGWSCAALTLQAEANPIRKVVTILQDMQKELEAEGDKEKDLFDKFMCFCDGNTDGMSAAAEKASQDIVELKSKLEAEKAEKTQLDQELVQHKLDREKAKADFEQATMIREKEHEEYVAATGDMGANLEAMTGAIDALAKGMGESFLQSAGKKTVLIQAVQRTEAVDDYQKDELLGLLQGKNPFGAYSGQSGEIVGMLKAMKDEMAGDLKGTVAAEEAAAKGFDELAAAKKSEIAAASEAIESKTVRSGELAVAVTTTADDIEDTTAEMKETEAFLANLGAQCAMKKKEWAERQSMRAEEVAAIGEAIKILNDDDALDLFKKTLSLAQSPTVLLQQKSTAARALRARTVLAKASKTSVHATTLSLLEAQLKAKKVDFSKIIAQIDGMEKVLAAEQKEDEDTKAFCTTEIEKADGEKADTEEGIAASTAAIEEMTESSASLASEIDSLGKEIKALDKAVTEATEQRKEEHEDFITFQTENNAAVQLIEKAKNRLFKFYRPNMYKEAPKKELTEEEKLLVASGAGDMVATAAPEMIAGTSIAAMQTSIYAQLHQKTAAAPPAPPATWGAYQKKDGKSNGVIALMEMLAKELEDGMTTSEHEEETAQKDYERLMSTSQESRAKNVESITTKEAAKAELDTKIEATKEKKASQETTLVNVKQLLVDLHAKCDFIIENFDMRKAARETEKEGLDNAKSVLSGANFE
jgi:hypothetical protein